MNKEITPKTKKPLPYWTALIMWVALTCVISNLLTLLPQFGAFTTWKSLSKPASGATHIRDADGDNVWVEAADGNLYTLTLFCVDNENCKQWKIVNASAEIHPLQCRPMKRAADCTSLKSSFFPYNPLIGEGNECVVANGCFPDPAYGSETWFASMSDGGLRHWEHGNGSLGLYISFICSTIVLPICTAIIVTAIYKDKKRERKALAG